jgi:hypothetical protein
MSGNRDMLAVERAESLIVEIRGQRVIVDGDLASLYEVETRALNQAVKRNSDRFPDDFMFQLTRDEATHLATSHVRLKNLKFSRTGLSVFTEHGAIMTASVLNSPRAVEASIFVVRAFVKLRQLLAAHKELAHKVDQLERRLGDHDEAIRGIVTAIKQLMAPPPAPTKRQIGFHAAAGN